MRTKTMIALLLVFSFLTACAQVTPTTAYPPPGSVTEVPTAVYPYPQPTQPVSPAPTPTTNPTELTPAQQAAIQAVSKKYAIPADQITIVSTDPMTWNNGCMGVVLPGVLCTDVIVNGFIVKLSANGRQFEMHTNQDGTSVIDAAQQLATLGFVVLSADRSIQLVNPAIPLGQTYNPAFNGLPPLGSSLAGTAYVFDSSYSKVLAVNATGQNALTFIQNPTYGLAIWRGGSGSQPLIAWGTQPLGNGRTTTLMVAGPDGSNQKTLLSVDAQTTAPIQLVAEFWSADGKSLYFSKEPVGIGGYIIFSGASNLYKIEISTLQVTEIIPQAASNQPQICLDAISGDYRYVADHCTQNSITIRDLQAGTAATLQLPADFKGYRLMGSARFSPAGDQVAFALAKGDPNAEQGWVAIGPSTGGTAKLILTGDQGSYYNVMGWLDDQTVLVQSIAVGSATAVNQLFTVTTDGTTVTKVAEGILLAILSSQ